MMYYFKKDFDKLGIHDSLRVRDNTHEGYLNIEDFSNGGRIAVSYAQIPEFKRFIRKIIKNTVKLPSYVYGDDKAIQLEYSWNEMYPNKIRVFHSNWIYIDRLRDVIKILDNVCLGIGKVVLTPQDLDKYNITSLLYIKKRINNRKKYNEEDGVKYLII